MPTPEDIPQVTFLPDQARRLGDLAEVTRGALGVRQNGSVLHIRAAEFELSIGPNGKTLGSVQYKNNNQERLC